MRSTETHQIMFQKQDFNFRNFESFFSGSKYSQNVMKSQRQAATSQIIIIADDDRNVFVVVISDLIILESYF